ncbi:MAG: hypothetical protein LBR81_08725 [Prevotellaceae bacterium]|nr:hypothetical protein [Prevotellaceae bacterium]
MSKKSIFISILIVVLVAALGFMGWKFYESQQEIAQQEEALKGANELLDYEREQTEREMRELAIEVEGYGTANIRNDSLVKLLDTQKEKIRMLLEEIRTVKSTNGKRIAELKAELGLVRQVLISYIRQVDSLNQINKGLVTENVAVKQKNSELSQTAAQLTEDKKALTETVSRAAQLEAHNFLVKTLNRKDKETKKLSRIAKIAISFNIAKNITAPVGVKSIFVRIAKPNNEVLSKNPSNVFRYEDRNIQYSIKKDVEYKGERVIETVYWDVSETLLPGTYRFDFFADERLIGNGSFVLKK